MSATYTVRRIVQGQGIERVFPVHSPFVQKVEVRRSGKIRRSRLYYLRDRTGKATRLKEIIRPSSRKKAKPKKAAPAPKAKPAAGTGPRDEPPSQRFRRIARIEASPAPSKGDAAWKRKTARISDGAGNAPPSATLRRAGLDRARTQLARRRRRDRPRPARPAHAGLRRGQDALDKTRTDERAPRDSVAQRRRTAAAVALLSAAGFGGERPAGAIRPARGRRRDSCAVRWQKNYHRPQETR